MTTPITDPLAWLVQWYEEAKSRQLPEPNAMTLATVSAEGRPSARIVLMKDADEHGVTFFTNYNSRKGHELDQNPNVALIFFWATLERQIRVEGTVIKVPRAVSEAYFATRARISQLGAWTSQQSQEIPSSEALKQEFLEVEKRFKDQVVPCPPHWGGFLVQPTSLEFWIGKPGRLHERHVFKRATLQASWVQSLLSP